MGDDITIGVTEIVNNIEVTAQPNDQIVDISVIDNTDEVTLNITPTVIEINVNKGSSYAKWGTILGTLSEQTDLQNALNLKADLVDGKVPSSQLPSYVDDVIEVANYAALPVVGESGKIYITIDNNHIFRWTGSTYVEITDNTAVWGAITGTLSSQTDLVSALNLRVPYTGATANINLGEYGLTSGFLGLDTTPTSTPTGIGTIYWDAANRTAALIDGDGDTTLQIGQEERILVHNNTGSTLTDGQVVYVTGSTGELPSISLANAGAESTSAATIGVVTESIPHGSDGFITTSGIVHGLNTLAFNEGDLLWLGTTSGTFTTTKPTSPNHLVLIGYVIKKSGGNGSILVKIQNTQELAESSDVLFTSLANNQVLTYDSATSLWKNKSLSTILGYTPANDSLVVHLASTETISGTKTFSSGSTIWDNASSNILDFKISGTSVANFNFGTTFTQFTSKATSGYLFKNSALANSLAIDNSGNGTFLGSLTASSIIKSGGTSSQFLKADGSVDSSTYSLDSNVVHKTGDETIAGSKTFTNLAKFTNGSGLYAVEIDVSAIDALVIKNTGSTTFQIGRNGEALGVKYKVSGGTTNQFLKANGDLDSNTYALTSQLHNAVTIGTANGLSLSTQVLSLGLASGSTNGALSSTDWTTFNNKQNALTNPITGIGTSGYHTKFTGASTLGNSLIYDNGTNLGIGTTSPQTLFDLRGQYSQNFIISNVAKNQISINVNGNNYAHFYDVGLSTINGGLAIGGSGTITGVPTTPTMFWNVNNGNVGIGTTTDNGAKLNVAGSGKVAAFGSVGSGDDNYISFVGTSNTFDVGVTAGSWGIADSGVAYRFKVSQSGNVYVSTLGTGLLYSNAGTLTSTNPSDSRLKDDIADLQYGLNEILQLRPVSYLWKNNTINQGKQYGFIAQEVQEVMPELVKEFDTIDGEEEVIRLGLDKEAIFVTLINAIKELNDKIAILENKQNV